MLLLSAESWKVELILAVEGTEKLCVKKTFSLGKEDSRRCSGHLTRLSELAGDSGSSCVYSLGLPNQKA